MIAARALPCPPQLRDTVPPYENCGFVTRLWRWFVAAQADERVMASERIAPGMLPRVLNTTDMTIIFLAIVLFVVQASVIQPAGPSA